MLTLVSVTQLTEAHRGAVVVIGSHGGRYPAWCVARAGLRGVVLNDGGGGLEGAGFAGLALLDQAGIPGATIDAFAARIGDGEDMLARGRVSRLNEAAAALGCRIGDPARLTAERMERGPAHVASGLPKVEEGRHRISAAPSIWALDSLGLIGPEHEDAILVVGSHAGVPEAMLDRAVPVRPRALVLNDAGLGIEEAGVRSLEPLARRSIPALAVSAASARIGSGLSAWESGIVSRANAPALALGAATGGTVRDFVAALTAASPIPA